MGIEKRKVPLEIVGCIFFLLAIQAILTLPKIHSQPISQGKADVNWLIQDFRTNAAKGLSEMGVSDIEQIPNARDSELYQILKRLDNVTESDKERIVKTIQARDWLWYSVRKALLSVLILAYVMNLLGIFLKLKVPYPFFMTTFILMIVYGLLIVAGGIMGYAQPILFIRK